MYIYICMHIYMYIHALLQGHLFVKKIRYSILYYTYIFSYLHTHTTDTQLLTATPTCTALQDKFSPPPLKMCMYHLLST